MAAQALAYLTASLASRFPNTVLSLIRSFIRHPALVSRETKMTAPTRRNLMAFRQFGAAAAVTATLALATPAHAVTEIAFDLGRQVEQQLVLELAQSRTGVDQSFELARCQQN